MGSNVFENQLSNNIQLHHIYWFRAPANEVKPVTTAEGHEKIEIVLSGKVNFPYKGKTICFSKGAMFWHTAGQNTIFENHIDDPYECIAIDFEVKNEPIASPPRVSRWQDPEQALMFSRHLYETYQNKSFSNSFLGTYAYSRLLIEAERATRNDLLVEPWPPALRKSVLFIEANYIKPIQLTEVAAHAEISVPYLHKLFSEHLHKSPHRIILELRMKKARKYLTESLSKLREIASLCGFGTPEYFCRIFAQEHGMTPMVYREIYTDYRTKGVSDEITM